MGPYRIANCSKPPRASRPANRTRRRLRQLTLPRGLPERNRFGPNQVAIGQGSNAVIEGKLFAGPSGRGLLPRRAAHSGRTKPRGLVARKNPRKVAVTSVPGRDIDQASSVLDRSVTIAASHSKLYTVYQPSFSSAPSLRPGLLQSGESKGRATAVGGLRRGRFLLKPPGSRSRTRLSLRVAKAEVSVCWELDRWGRSRAYFTGSTGSP